MLEYLQVLVHQTQKVTTEWRPRKLAGEAEGTGD
jgi:hypothetical protein